MALLWSIVRIGIAVYAGTCLLVLFRQSRYVYYPDKRVDIVPSQMDMEFEDVRLETSDGETLGAWFVPTASGAPDAATILFCHGNAGDIGDRVGSLRTFHDLGLNVLIFDYRGYGDSTGKPSEKGTYRDVKAAWDYLSEERKIAPGRIVVFGRSLGGSVASWLAPQVEAGALILESTFTSAPDMASQMFPFLPVRWLTRFRYDTLARMKDIKCPVLVAHSRRDQMIPFSHAKRIFEAANEPKKFVEFPGGHNDGGLDISPEYQKELKKFVDAQMGNGADRRLQGE